MYLEMLGVFLQILTLLCQAGILCLSFSVVVEFTRELQRGSNTSRDRSHLMNGKAGPNATERADEETSVTPEETMLSKGVRVKVKCSLEYVVREKRD